jgi:hypothetical protein
MPTDISDFAHNHTSDPDVIAHGDAVLARGVPVDAGPRPGDYSNEHPGHAERMLEHSRRVRDDLVRLGSWSEEQEQCYRLETAGRIEEMTARLRTGGARRRLGKPLPAKTVAQIVALGARGMTCHGIAKALGLEWHKVSTSLRRMARRAGRRAPALAG